MNNPWIKALKERIEGRYETEGWRVLSGVEVEQSLRNCRFAPEAYRRLRDGYGFLVQASCGCLYKINLKGETFLAYHCEEGEDCQSILLPAKENRGPVFVGRDIPLSTRCFDCGSAFLMDSILGRKGKKGYTEVIFDIKCPRCKQAVSRTGSTWVSYDRLIFVRK